MENHDAALRVWREAGVRRRVLIHVDAHHDLVWAKDSRCLVDIANFICFALRENLVREIAWVTPDASWNDPSSRRALVVQANDLIAKYPQSSGIREEGPAHLTFQLQGIKVHVCKLGSLPAELCREAVLLDLDVDFMVIPRVYLDSIAIHSDQPWIQPAEVLDRLEAAGILPELVTIAYSVNGGYTPLKWKYLGDELAARLTGDPIPARGPLDYNTPFVNLAFPFYQTGQWDRARAAFQEVLTLDAENAWARLGLGLLAVKAKDWKEAEVLLREGLERNRNMTDALRALAEILERSGRDAEAIANYERSLLLALKGHASILDAICTPGVDGAVRDEQHGEVHYRLARLYERRGDLKRAAGSYAIAAAGANYRTRVNLRMARTLAGRGKYARALAACGTALTTIPPDLRRVWNRKRRPKESA